MTEPDVFIDFKDIPYTDLPEDTSLFFNAKQVCKQIPNEISDCREIIDKPVNYPYYNRVVKLFSVFPYNKNGYKWEVWEGTGTIVGDRHIITCAHNLYNHYLDADAAHIIIIPVMDGTVKPGGYIIVSGSNGLHYFKQYKKPVSGQAPRSFYDIGLIRINSAQPVFKHWLSLGFIPENMVPGTRILHAGYPYESPFAKENIPFHNNLSLNDLINLADFKMIKVEGIIRAFVKENLKTNIAHPMRTKAGNSGGPLFFHNKVVGVHTEGHPAGTMDDTYLMPPFSSSPPYSKNTRWNRAYLFDQSHLEQVKKWIS